jgi:hypothetical protein
MAEFRRGDGGIGCGTEERWSGPDESSATGGDICLCANQDLFPSSCSEAIIYSSLDSCMHCLSCYAGLSRVWLCSQS